MNKNYETWYNKMAAVLRQHPVALTTLRLSNKFVVMIMYLSYIAILLWVGLKEPRQLWKFIIIPGISFILLSIGRNIINAPRPYERWQITPLIVRHKKGDSMPSRHVFSAALIAMCALRLNIGIGICLLVLTVVAAVTRVIGGVHFPKDVLMGMLCGVVAGLGLFLV